MQKVIKKLLAITITMSERILNLFKIKVLAEVCKTNSYRITANNLHITPSAVSKIIKGLEKEWNLPLVASKGNSISVNAQAEQLAQLGNKILKAGEEFNDYLSLLNQTSRQVSLKIGSGGSHSKIMMNRVLGSFLKVAPTLEYEVVTNNSAEILKAVDIGELDCGIVSGLVSAHVHKELIFQDNISLYAYHGHPLAKKVVTLDAIDNLFCLREKGSSTRFYVEQFFNDRGFKLSNSRQTGKNDELTDHLCKTQQALQFLSDFYYQNSHWRKEYVKIQCSDLQIPIPIYFITRKNFPFPKLRKHIKSIAFQDEILAS